MLLTKGCPDCGSLNRITINGVSQCWDCYKEKKPSKPANKNTAGKTAQRKPRDK